MKATYYFPIAMIALDIGAAIMCIVSKEYKKAVYWIAAAVLNAAVTFQFVTAPLGCSKYKSKKLVILNSTIYPLITRSGEKRGSERMIKRIG